MKGYQKLRSQSNQSQAKVFNSLTARQGLPLKVFQKSCHSGCVIGFPLAVLHYSMLVFLDNICML